VSPGFAEDIALSPVKGDRELSYAPPGLIAGEHYSSWGLKPQAIIYCPSGTYVSPGLMEARKFRYGKGEGN